MDGVQKELEQTVAMAQLFARGPRALEDFHEVAGVVRQVLLCEYWGRYKGADTTSTDLEAQAAWVAEMEGSVEEQAATEFVEERGNELLQVWMEGRVYRWLERNMVDAFAAITEARRSQGQGGTNGSG